jgi:Zn-dependent membrane protease YugP
VKVTQGQGYLTDHYHPGKKTVTLSPEVFQGRSISAAAVAAHECGHAVQHATAYSWLEMRSALVPVVSFAARSQQWLLLLAIGGLGGGFQAGSTLLLITVIAFAMTTLFSLITLPVEFDATKRGLVWLRESGVTGSQQEYAGAKDALNWAAMTYVVAALSSLAMTFWLLLRFLGGE